MRDACDDSVGLEGQTRSSTESLLAYITDGQELGQMVPNKCFTMAWCGLREQIAMVAATDGFFLA